MPRQSAPLLSPQLVEQTKRLAGAIRRAEVAPLVGTGLSIPRGLPSWTELVNRLILAWREWDDSDAKRRLSPDNYVRFMRQVFRNDLAVASYLRNRVAAVGLSFGQILYSALYAPAGVVFTPDPSDIHRHLVKLFARHPARIWTTNYDDLLEEAARSMGIPASTRDPQRRGVGRDLSVAHLHGFLAPPARAEGHPGPGAAAAILTLAEEDFYGITHDLIGWTNREFIRLFDEYRTLICGMSLDDPNVRRMLIASRTEPPTAEQEPRHFAVMRALAIGPQDLPRTRPHTRARYAQEANAFRAWYWRQYGVEVIDLPDHDTILPFLVRLRYESYGAAPGALWRAGAARGYEAIQPWEPEQQRVARLLLHEAVTGLKHDFAVTSGEVVEMGIFLVQPDGATLELTFRGGGPKSAEQGGTRFSADPDRPTGVAGRVFVSGDVVRARRDDPLHNYGLTPAMRPAPGSYEAIISAPLIDWEADGVPVGVVYVSLSTTSGTLFNLPVRSPGVMGDQKTLDDVAAWLHISAMEALSVLRKMGRKG